MFVFNGHSWNEKNRIKIQYAISTLLAGIVLWKSQGYKLSVSISVPMYNDVFSSDIIFDGHDQAVLNSINKYSVAGRSG